MANPKGNFHQFFIWQPVLLVTLFAVGVVVGGGLNVHSPKMPPGEGEESARGMQRVFSPKTQYQKIVDVLKYIETQYVDDVSTDELMDEAIRDIMDSLDPHSYYISRDQFKEFSELTRGDFEGVGIEFLRLRDTLFITRVMPEGPAEKVDLEAGDQILWADSVDLSRVESLDSIKSLIKGPRGSMVTLRVKRGQDFLNVDVQRDVIIYHSVEYYGKLNDSTNYVKLTKFNRNAYREFMSSLDSLAEKGQLQRLVIDLRGNPGGYLGEVVKILSQLFERKGRLLVYTKDRTGVKKEYKSSGRSYYTIDDIFVLMNENSASASEILAGAIQDWERGLIIGRRSFGKGLVQEEYSLGDGSAIRLTTARYHTPSGRMIQRPYGNGQYDKESHNRYLSGEYFSIDSIANIDTSRYRTQFGNSLKSGLGIIPDVFVPRDSLEFDSCLMKTFTFLPEFAFQLVHGYIIEEQKEINFASELSQQERNLVFSKFQQFLSDRKEVECIGTISQEEREFLVDRVVLSGVQFQYGPKAYFRSQLKSDPYIKAIP